MPPCGLLGLLPIRSAAGAGRQNGVFTVVPVFTHLPDTEKLVWSAQSETVNPGTIDNFVRDYPKKLVAQMVNDGLLKK